MSLNDILKIERERVQRERVVITTVYDRMKNRINNSVKARSKECIYTIPEFIPGYTLIDVVKTMNYLLTKLRKEGFIAFQLSMLDIYVTWDPVKIRELNKQLLEIEQSSNTSSNDIGGFLINKKNIEKQKVEKEFERANEDFINALVVSKKKTKN